MKQERTGRLRQHEKADLPFLEDLYLMITLVNCSHKMRIRVVRNVADIVNDFVFYRFYVNNLGDV